MTEKKANNLHWKQGLYGCSVCPIVPDNGISTLLGPMVSTGHVAAEKRNFSHPTFSQRCFVGSQQGSGFVSWSHFKRKSSSIQFAFPPFSNETTYMWANPMIMQNRWAGFCLIRFWTACLLVVNVHIFRDFTLTIETTD